MSNKTMSMRYGMHWSRTKKAVKRAAGGRCARCGGQYLLTVHHIDGNRRNHVRSNLTVLCEPCHREVHEMENPT
jgi:5-methylcytosine-specific restriction endonuclease McrA